MKKLKSDFTNMVLVLTGITVLAACALGSVYSLTRDPINKSQQTRRLQAIRDVLPPYDSFDSIPVILNNGVETTKVYKAYDKNHALVGAAVESTSNNGYKGPIDIIVGFDKVGTIVNYSVLDQHETPGLGAKMGTWFKTKKAKQDIRGKNAAIANLNVSKDGGEVDAITAATISSRAFLFAVRNAYFAFTTNLDAHGNEMKHDADTTHAAVNNATSTPGNHTLKGQQQ